MNRKTWTISSAMALAFTGALGAAPAASAHQESAPSMAATHDNDRFHRGAGAFRVPTGTLSPEVAKLVAAYQTKSGEAEAARTAALEAFKTWRTQLDEARVAAKALRDGADTDQREALQTAHAAAQDAYQAWLAAIDEARDAARAAWVASVQEKADDDTEDSDDATEDSATDDGGTKEDDSVKDEAESKDDGEAASVKPTAWHHGHDHANGAFTSQRHQTRSVTVASWQKDDDDDDDREAASSEGRRGSSAGASHRGNHAAAHRAHHRGSAGEDSDDLSHDRGDDGGDRDGAESGSGSR